MMILARQENYFNIFYFATTANRLLINYFQSFHNNMFMKFIPPMVGGMNSINAIL